MLASSLSIAASYIREQLALRLTRPLIVGIQGPQGSGKSYLSSLLLKDLGRNSLRVVVLSIDDLYLPHSGLTALAKRFPHNALLEGRGQPGTHDVQLGISLLSALQEGRSEIMLPSFDKSLFDGEGDRLPMDDSRIVIIQPPADVIILEGWCVGFQPASPERVEEDWEGVWKREKERLGIADSLCSKSDIMELNEHLAEYQALWERFDLFIQLKPSKPIDDTVSQYSIIYQWRLEQEHYMKSMNGNRGMSDEGVRKFVDRYIPGYVFFLRDTLERRWEGKCLVLTLDNDREVVETNT